MLSSVLDNESGTGTIAAVNKAVKETFSVEKTTKASRIKKINALIESHEVYSEEEDEKNYNITKIAFAIWALGLVAIIVGMAVYKFRGNFGATGRPILPSMVDSPESLKETLRHAVSASLESLQSISESVQPKLTK